MLQMPTRPSRFAHSRAAGLFGALTAVSRRRSSSVSCCSKNSPALNCSTPRRSSAGGGSSQRARTDSCGAPRGWRLGGRAALRSRAVGVRSARSGVFAPCFCFGADDLAEPELVLEEFADGLVPEGSGQLLRRVGVDDLDALVEVVRRDEVAVLQRVHP